MTTHNIIDDYTEINLTIAELQDTILKNVSFSIEKLEERISNELNDRLVLKLQERILEEGIIKKKESTKEDEKRIRQLEEENSRLQEKLLEIERQQEIGSSILLAPVVNQDLVEELRSQIADLQAIVNSRNVCEVQYDLKLVGFKEIFTNSKLKIDYPSAEITGEILNKFFVKWLKKGNNFGFCNYEFGARTINKDLTLKQWISLPTSKFKLEGHSYDNTFDTKEPTEKKISLGTGTGKSTFFLRCLAFHNKGATLVVPYSSLVDSVVTSHRDWLSKEEEGQKDERIIICPICEEKHTNYETVHKGSSTMINVFTWWEFLNTYINEPEIIKKWVVFDEAHTDLPAYQALIKRLIDNKKRNFKIVQMSATFGDLPTSRKLTGTITDYYVTDFAKLLNKNPEIFKKKVIVFVDNLEKLDIEWLEKKGVKCIFLDDSLKDYATDIVRSLEAPLLVFANRSYSVGFSFGDVNVISTGISSRIMVTNNKGEKEIVEGQSDFSDLLQERGRAAREKDYSGVWMSLIPSPGNYIGKLKKDYMAEGVENFFKTKDFNKEDIDKVNKVISLASKPNVAKEIGEKEGNLTLNRILLKTIKDKLDPIKLFKVLPSEKSKRSPGEIVFRNPLLKYFKEKDLKDIIITVTKEKIEIYSKQYDWFFTPEQEDDYVFNNEADAKVVGFYLQSRESYKLEKKFGKEGEIVVIILSFKSYELDKIKTTISHNSC